MALGETANLAVNLTLKGNFYQGMGQAQKSLAGTVDSVKKLDAGVASIGSRFSRLTQSQGFKDFRSGLGLGAGVAGFQLAGQAVAGVINIMSDAVGAASELAESQSKVDQVFTESSQTIRSWAQGSARDFGLTEAAALEAAGTFGNFIQALGNTESEATDMSKTLVELAGDLASFNNQDINEVIIALRSGLAGEAEPMRRLGVSISETRVQNNILAKGLVRTKDEITDAMKVAERYAIIMQDTAKAQGDFDRTSGGLANSQRILNAELGNLSAKLGGILIGPATGFVQFLSNVATSIGGGGQGVTQRVTELKTSLQELREEAQKGAGAGTMLAEAWEPLTRSDISRLNQINWGEQVPRILELANSLRLTDKELNDFLSDTRQQGGMDKLVPALERMLAATSGSNALKLLHPQMFAVQQDAEDMARSIDVTTLSFNESYKAAHPLTGVMAFLADSIGHFGREADDATDEAVAFGKAQAQAAARTERLNEALELVSSEGFSDLRASFKDVQRSIREAFRTDSVKELERESRILQKQLRRAENEREFDAAAIIRVQLAQIQQQIRQRRLAAAHARAQAREDRERKNAIREVARAFNLPIGKARELFTAASKDPKMTITVNDGSLDSAIAKVQFLGSVANTAINKFFAPVRPKGQAAGGPYQAMKAYLVGENGPEVRVEKRGGYTLSKSDAQRAIGGGGGGDVTVYVTPKLTVAAAQVQSGTGKVQRTNRFRSVTG